jgi:Protein of unknown function (DUF1569)
MDPGLRRLQEAIEASIRGLSAEQIAWGLPGKWSTAQILEHLFLTYTGTAKGCQRCLEAGKPLADSPTLRQRLRVAFVVHARYMPRGHQAPERSRPKGTPSEIVVAEIGAKIAAMDELIAQCEARHGKRVPLMNHPVLGPMTGPQWRGFHCVHGNHHVKQILGLRKEMRDL